MSGPCPVCGGKHAIRREALIECARMIRRRAHAHVNKQLRREDLPEDPDEDPRMQAAKVAAVDMMDGAAPILRELKMTWQEVMAEGERPAKSARRTPAQEISRAERMWREHGKVDPDLYQMLRAFYGFGDGERLSRESIAAAWGEWVFEIPKLALIGNGRGGFR